MAIAADVVGKPFFTSTNHVINYKVTSDENRKVPTDLTGVTVALLLTDLGGSTISYAGTNVAGTGGTGSWTLVGSNHTTVGAATAQVHMDGVCKAEYTMTFRAKKVAS